MNTPDKKPLLDEEGVTYEIVDGQLVITVPANRPVVLRAGRVEGDSDGVTVIERDADGNPTAVRIEPLPAR